MNKPALNTIVAAAMLLAVGVARGQEGSLWQAPPSLPTGQFTIENSSILYQPLPPEAQARELMREDIITVLVDYRTSMLSEGQTQNRKTANFNAVLAEWLAFDGNSITGLDSVRQDPEIAGQLNSQYRAQSDLEVRDSLTLRIAAKVVDIQPNGNLVIEAHRQIRNNDEVWEQSLSGVVSRQFINADRTVLSDKIADLKIYKRELGQVRNGYAPGWLAWWYGKYKPF
ncbi:Flagellar L-ring protein precursor [Pirellulimonas nuda]|uniref:Flagellar L-ring protein n=1 Tax=Pirellulimonas nuda TaxID=2528009 RepID=A0A518DFR7_9BACT|nr:flagellar basal body L-ring protein FlgH [Pirellulimonas nuda]QDU90319.1 Flagellar L-ring protein precursor [Pirellulimonas nuda]